MSRELEKLRNLLKVIKAGNDFYEHSKVKTDDPNLRAFFDKNLEKGGVLFKQLKEYHAELVAELKAEDLQPTKLEKLESKILNAFQEALVVAGSPGLESILEDLQAEFEQVHDAFGNAK